MTNRAQTMNHRGNETPFLRNESNLGNSFLTSSTPRGPSLNADGSTAWSMAPFEKWAPYFGEPNAPWKTKGTYGGADVQHQVLPEAYEGANVYLRDLIIRQIEEDDVWPYTELAPLVVMEDSMEIRMDTLVFNHDTLDRTPEEALSRLTTYTQETKSDTLVRYGLAFLMSTAMMNTPKGDEIYTGQITQIKNATSDSIAYGALWHVLNHTPYKDRNARYRGNADNSINHVDEVIKDELAQWAGLHKRRNFPSILMDNLKKEMNSRGEKPGDYMVWPMGASKFGKGDPANENYMYSGRPYDANRNYLSEQTSGEGIKQRESKGWPMGGHSPVDDPNFRSQTIGGYNFMTDLVVRDVPDEEYRTSHLDIYIYSEKLDGFVRIRYEDACRHTGLYDWDNDEDGVPATDIGMDYFASFAKQRGIGAITTWGQYYKALGLLDRVVDKLYKDLNGKPGCGKNNRGVLERFKEIFFTYPTGPASASSVAGPVSAAYAPLGSGAPAARDASTDEALVKALAYDQAKYRRLRAIAKKNSGSGGGSDSDDDEVGATEEEAQAQAQAQGGSLLAGIQQLGGNIQGMRTQFAQATSTAPNGYDPQGNPIFGAAVLRAQQHIDSRAATDDEIPRAIILDMLVNDTDKFGIQSGAFWKFQVNYDGYQSMGVLLLKPHQTYRMGTAIYGHSGGQAARTAIGHADFQIGNDAGRKMVYGHFTVYFKTMVLNARRLILAHNILCAGYEGGNGHEFWDPLDEEYDVDDYMKGRITRDIFACAIPINWQEPSFYMDITGRHHQSMEASGSAYDSKLHYESADVYKRYWKWIPSAQSPLNKSYFTEHAKSSKFNTLVFRNVQFGFQWSAGVNGGGGDFSHVLRERGHWGERVYEGCGDVRAGRDMYFERPDYLSTKTMTLSS